MSNIGFYMKAVIAACTAAATAAITALADNGNITGVEWCVIAGAFLAALGGVWAADNERWFPYAKAVTSALIAAVGVLGVALTDGGVSSAEWLGVLIALVGGGGLVAGTANAKWSDLQREIPNPEGYDL